MYIGRTRKRTSQRRLNKTCIYEYRYLRYCQRFSRDAASGVRRSLARRESYRPHDGGGGGGRHMRTIGGASGGEPGAGSETKRGVARRGAMDGMW